ncbi:MAG: ABC transporter ATP-binding protein [Thermodesulfovibrionales bacterium]
MIELKEITVSAGGFSIRDLSLNIQTGSCHILIGPTGCGKTTLLEAVLGLRRIKKGTIMLDGKDITNLPVHERGFSYVPQDLAIFPHLTVEDNILYGIRHGNVSDKQKRYEAGLEIAESLGISPLMKRKAVNLSGGERQRVALARALAPGHKYLLLDEPLSALHEGMKRELWFLLKELQKKYDLTILMVSHDLEETFFLADNISIMIDGHIHQTGQKDEIYHNPSTFQVADFFGIKNIFKAEKMSCDNDKVLVYCPELGTSLVVPAHMNEKIEIGKPFFIGIRPEEVMILRHDKYKSDQDNLLHGTITAIFKKGSFNTILFKPRGASRTIEIDVPNYAFRKLDIKETQDVKVTLRKENLFFIGEAL